MGAVSGGIGDVGGGDVGGGDVGGDIGGGIGDVGGGGDVGGNVGGGKGITEDCTASLTSGWLLVVPFCSCREWSGNGHLASMSMST